jgi:hypothetical protein
MEEKEQEVPVWEVVQARPMTDKNLYCSLVFHNFIMKLLF